MLSEVGIGVDEPAPREPVPLIEKSEGFVELAEDLDEDFDDLDDPDGLLRDAAPPRNGHAHPLLDDEDLDLDSDSDSDTDRDRDPTYDHRARTSGGNGR